VSLLSPLGPAPKPALFYFGIDVDPAYVEVAIRRWQKHTGHDAIHVLTGLTFDEYVERMRPECTAGKPAADARVDGDGQVDGAASDSRG